MIVAATALAKAWSRWEKVYLTLQLAYDPIL
jgi:hypothetical protein